jgi:hypothetical protein
MLLSVAILIANIFVIMMYVYDTYVLCPGDEKLLGHKAVSVASKRIRAEVRKWWRPILIFVAALQ